MKGVICYYSGSGNTKLACQYLLKRLERQAEFTLFDITRNQAFDPQAYDLVGFATFADFLAPPLLFRTFIKNLPRQSGKWAFVLNTYGNFNGRTLFTLADWVKARGFRILAGHALHTPESYPPMIVAGVANTQAPDEKELAGFDAFIANLNRLLSGVATGRDLQGQNLSGEFTDRWMPHPPHKLISRWFMGDKRVDADRCNECGSCAKLCPYQAIELHPKPVFNESRCNECWSCYNHCPQKAIYTKKYRDVGHYPRPIEELKAKLEK